ncbi:MAG: TetR/AcrR family transcriptional regulator [Alphaproteobacteria bacterium]
MNATLELQPRKEPKQARARRTFERILSATGELLDEVGIDHVTTNLVAARAGVNIASLYKYFPNKYALLNFLALRLAGRQTEAIRGYLRTVDPATPWRQVSDGIIDVMVDSSRAEPGYSALQRAFLAVPELHDAYRRTSAAISREMNGVLRRWGIDLPERRLDLLVLIMGESSAALLDLAASRGRTYDAAIIDELKTLMRGYLMAYIVPPFHS